MIASTTGEPGKDRPGSSRFVSLVLSPWGHLRLEELATGDDSGAEEVTPELGEALSSAFRRGGGHGLLRLGTSAAGRQLPPALGWWRDLAERFVSAVCTLPDLEENRKELNVPVPAGALASALESVPPLRGSEYLSTEVLTALWMEMDSALGKELSLFDGGLQEYLKGRNPLWNTVGRVHFHLAERKSDSAAPFAFLATYTTRLGRLGRAKHVPLGKGLEEYAGARNRQALLALLRPVQAASEQSPLVKELVDSGEVFHPLAWSAEEAYRFLKEVPVLEAAGLVTSIPDWWRSRSAGRPQVQVSVGSRPPGGALGLQAILDFSVGVVLNGEALTKRELRELLAAGAGLALVRGRWVEVDPERLSQVLAHFESVRSQAGDGVTLLEGMRLLSGAPRDAGSDELLPEESEAWTSRVAGPWLREALERLRCPETMEELGATPGLLTELRPYQRTGLTWLWHVTQLGLGGCLADDMGLGKTVQVLALLLQAKRRGVGGPHLLVVPASLMANWQAEIARFAPGLRTLLAHPASLGRGRLAEIAAEDTKEFDLVITTYGFLGRLPWVGTVSWGMVVLDEAQAIKNPGAKQTRTVKSLRSRVRLALTGTPVENRLGDLWSLFDFINPGLLGTAPAFARLARRLEARSHDQYGPLRRLVRPYILRRLKTDRRVIADLPEKTQVLAYCPLTKGQAALYQEAVEELAERIAETEGIRRRGLVLAYLTRLKQICNHPSQWLGDGAYEPAASGKFGRLREIAEELASRQDKVLVFTQYRELTGPLSEQLASVFGRPGLVLHGQTPVAKRRELVDRFQADERVPFFVLSLKAGGTGLNLTAASHVVHFDRWWNPAVEDQATDRAFRIGQKRNVFVHKFVCRGTVEEKIDALIAGKQRMAAELLEAGGEAMLTEMSDEELLAAVRLDIDSATLDT